MEPPYINALEVFFFLGFFFMIDLELFVVLKVRWSWVVEFIWRWKSSFFDAVLYVMMEELADFL